MHYSCACLELEAHSLPPMLQPRVPGCALGGAQAGVPPQRGRGRQLRGPCWAASSTLYTVICFLIISSLAIV